jgi:hypothetical protein
MRIIESRSIDNQAGLLGSRLITGTSTIEGAFQSFIVAEDTIVSKVYNSIGIDVTQKLGLTSVTLKAGAFISMAKGDYFSSIKLTSGSVVAYFVSHGGKTITADAYLNEFLARTGSSYLEAAECAKATLQGLINIGLLQKASLVMSPSMYEEDLVKSVVPQDGSGDLSFTRASDGTRINSAGLVEVVAWNLVEQSETFDNASWAKLAGGTSTVTVTANNGIAPNGTTTADRIQLTRDSSGFAQVTQTLTTTTSQSYTFSVYLKSLSGTPTVMFGSFGGTNAQTATLTNEWVRYTWTATSPSTSAFPMLMIWGGVASTSLSADFLAWGYQLNEGALKPYFPTTDRLNVPRLTYQNGGGGGCPSLLLEPQRTNLILQSNTFNTTWAMFTGPAVTPNTTTSPDGTTSATTLNSSGGTNDFLYQTLSGLTVGATYSFSFYIKNLNSTASRFWGPSGSSIVDLSWSGSTLVSISGTGASFTSVGNDWYRVVQTGTTPTATPTMRIYADVNNTSKSVYIYGAQFEAGSYPTSYIPTTSSSATRVADACFKTGISSLIGQTEGVIFCDVNLKLRTSFSYFAINNNGSSSQYVGIYFRTNAIELEVSNSGLQAGIVYSNTSTGRFKIAAAYKASDFVLYVNGTQIGTYTSGSVPTCNKLDLFAYSQEQPLEYNEAVLFPTRLTNAELASLTTL